MSAANIITVELNQLRFFAFHGVYAEELTTGNEFEVNAKIGFKPDKPLVTQLHDTVNYARVYAIIEEGMKHPEPLLETVVMKIGEQIRREYSGIRSVSIQLIKLNPPIIHFTGNVAVTYYREFGESA